MIFIFVSVCIVTELNRSGEMASEVLPCLLHATPFCDCKRVPRTPRIGGIVVIVAVVVITVLSIFFFFSCCSQY
jgi:hypothetical protein